MSRKTRSDRSGEAGFTLIEAVVALALVTIVLAAIGSLVATNSRGVRSLEQHVALVETARLIAASVARNADLSSDDLAGETADHLWQLRLSPFFGGGPVVSESRFIPALVELRVQSPTGAVLSLQTVRLQKRGGS